jgi:hypothetical protein
VSCGSCAVAVVGGAAGACWRLARKEEEEEEEEEEEAMGDADDDASRERVRLDPSIATTHEPGVLLRSLTLPLTDSPPSLSPLCIRSCVRSLKLLLV